MCDLNGQRVMEDNRQRCALTPHYDCCWIIDVNERNDEKNTVKRVEAAPAIFWDPHFLLLRAPVTLSPILTGRRLEMAAARSVP